MICRHESECRSEATSRYTWPGQSKPVEICDRHLKLLCKSAIPEMLNIEPMPVAVAAFTRPDMASTK